MTCSLEFIEFVCEQIENVFGGLGAIHYEKMMDDYMLYLNDRPVFLVCGEKVFVKKVEGIPQIEEKLADAPLAIPYNGAQEHYLLDINNHSLSVEVAEMLASLLPASEHKREFAEAMQ